MPLQRRIASDDRPPLLPGSYCRPYASQHSSGLILGLGLEID